MTLVLCRVDDRLIHGQVVVGWGQPLGIQRYRAGRRRGGAERLGAGPLPDGGAAGARGGVRHGGECRAHSSAPGTPTAGARRCCSGSIEAAAQLYHAAPTIVRKINLGGIHHRPGRVERLPYVYLSPEEHRLLTELAAEGAEIAGQDLPTATPVPLGIDDMSPLDAGDAAAAAGAGARWWRSTW